MFHTKILVPQCRDSVCFAVSLIHNTMPKTQQAFHTYLFNQWINRLTKELQNILGYLGIGFLCRVWKIGSDSGIPTDKGYLPRG